MKSEATTVDWLRFLAGDKVQIRKQDASTPHPAHLYNIAPVVLCLEIDGVVHRAFTIMASGMKVWVEIPRGLEGSEDAVEYVCSVR
jgi:hypothetical protein